MCTTELVQCHVSKCCAAFPYFLFSQQRVRVERYDGCWPQQPRRLSERESTTEPWQAASLRLLVSTPLWLPVVPPPCCGSTVSTPDTTVPNDYIVFCHNFDSEFNRLCLIFYQSVMWYLPTSLSFCCTEIFMVSSERMLPVTEKK